MARRTEQQKKERREKAREKNKNPNRFYVYVLWDKNKKPFYVGKGQGERARVSRYRHKLPCGSVPESQIIKDNLTESEALRYERYYCFILPNLSNKEPGGWSSSSGSGLPVEVLGVVYPSGKAALRAGAVSRKELAKQRE